MLTLVCCSDVQDCNQPLVVKLINREGPRDFPVGDIEIPFDSSHLLEQLTIRFYSIAHHTLHSSHSHTCSPEWYKVKLPVKGPTTPEVYLQVSFYSRFSRVCKRETPLNYHRILIHFTVLSHRKWHSCHRTTTCCDQLPPNL